MKESPQFRPVTLLILASLYTSAAGLACCSTSRSAVTPAFKSYDRVAIWSNLNRQQEEVFIPEYMMAFPNQTLVERRDLAAIIGEQEILPERLDEESRAKIRRILGVKAIVYPTYSGGYEQQFAIKVIDTETGAITAAIVLEDTSRRDVGVFGSGDASIIRRGIAKLKQAAAGS